LRRRLRPSLLSAQERLLAPLSEGRARRPLLDMLVPVIEANDSYARPGNGRESRAASPI